MSDLRNLLNTIHRADAEKYFAEHTRSEFMGNNTVLCQILGDRKFFAIADDIGFTPHMVMDGYWEFWLTRYFAKVLRPGDFVIDIGANQGYYTILASELVGCSGKVVAIEPNPEVFARLVASVQVNGFSDRVEALNVALALDGQGAKAPFFVPRHDCKNGRFVYAGEDPAYLAGFGDIIEVDAVRLEPSRFERVDFIKIDVEGAELAVIRQLRPLLEKFRPGLVCEVNFGRQYRYDDLVDALGTDQLHFLDYDSKVKPFTRKMAETENVGEDWLICQERT
ncbi:MAG: FkbM family methyltransferase [Gammaproteobacteria bacterium]|nr:FkbM family methyltransferase [Gammaproteobacteria bacterium]